MSQHSGHCVNWPEGDFGRGPATELCETCNLDVKERKAEALDVIFAIMDGTEWSADTTQEIAQVLTSVGYVISDCDEGGDEEPTTRLGRWQRTVEYWGDDWTGVLDGTLSSEDASALPGQFLLIETNVKGSEPPRWYSTHISPANAAEYHVHQEYADDWAIEGLIDLDTGETVRETVSANVTVSFS